MFTHVLLKNVSYLYLLQAANYLVPLLTTPYLARVLGVEEFGRLGVAAAVVGYFVIVGEWGFAYTAVEQVARNANEPPALRRILWDVLLGKAALAALSLAVLVPITLATPTLRDMWPTMAATALLLLNNVVAMHWFLQGVENLAASAVAGLMARLLTLPLIFVLVKSPADTWIAAAIFTGTLFLSSALSIVATMRSVPVLPVSVSIRGAFEQVRLGWHLALSNAAAGLYTYTNIVAVALLAGPAQAGYLNGAERIKRAVQNAIVPFSVALYPRINNMVVTEPHNVVRALCWAFALQGGSTLALSIAMFVSAPWLTLTFLGKDFAPAIPIVQLLSLTPFFAGVSSFLGANAMLPFGMKRAFTTIVVVSGMVNLALILPLAAWFGAIGAAAAYVGTEFLNMALMASWLFWKREAVSRTLANYRLALPVQQDGASSPHRS